MPGENENPDGDTSGALPPGTMAAVGELIKASADNPNVKAAGGELGKAMLTVARALNVVLLPIAAINYGYERARHYFESRFEPDLREKLADTPADDVVEPKPSLAGPIMQGLAFSHDEQALRDMYLNLLASAMNRRVADSAHPAFVEIIKQLTAQEAQSLCSALAPPETKEIVQIRLNMNTSPVSWRVLLNHLMPVTIALTRQPIENARFPAMVDNWVRLGLIEVSYTEYLHADASQVRYKWPQERPEFKRIQAEIEKSKPAGATLTVAPGSLRTTAFGAAFYETVGLQKILSNNLSELRNANARTQSG